MAQEADGETHALAIAEVVTLEIKALTRNVVGDAHIGNLVRRILCLADFDGRGSFHAAIAAGQPRQLAFGRIRVLGREHNTPKLWDGLRELQSDHGLRSILLGLEPGDATRDLEIVLRID